MNKEDILTSKALIKQLEQNGWIFVRVKGSHHHFKKEGVRHLVTVPHPEKDLDVGTLNSILKDAGLK